MDRFDAMRAFARVVGGRELHEGCPNASYEWQNHGDATHSAAGIAPARRLLHRTTRKLGVTLRWRGLRTRHPSAGGHGGC